MIKNAAKILRNKNPALIVTTMVICGSPKSVILKAAETFGTDLIIVGSHCHGAIEVFLLGSVY
ncbi:universal stress protein [Flavobacterium xueshanense]|uniref:universal stress protein n=1 Tax=Flavobacterium xueshanense TaxID=935223 RepID=UPI000B82728E